MANGKIKTDINAEGQLAHVSTWRVFECSRGISRGRCLISKGLGQLCAIELSVNMEIFWSMLSNMVAKSHGCWAFEMRLVWVILFSSHLNSYMWLVTIVFDSADLRCLEGWRPCKTSPLLSCKVFNRHWDYKDKRSHLPLKLGPAVEETSENSLRLFCQQCGRWILGTRSKTEGSPEAKSNCPN